jgi:hypothetical protein
LLLADGSRFESESLGYLKVGEVLPHEGKEALLFGSEALGEVVKDFAGFIGIGRGKIVEESLVGRGECYFTAAVREYATALPDNPRGLLEFGDIRTQRVEMLP